MAHPNDPLPRPDTKKKREELAKAKDEEARRAEEREKKKEDERGDRGNR